MNLKIESNLFKMAQAWPILSRAGNLIQFPWSLSLAQGAESFIDQLESPDFLFFPLSCGRLGEFIIQESDILTSSMVKTPICSISPLLWYEHVILGNWKQGGSGVLSFVNSAHPVTGPAECLISICSWRAGRREIACHDSTLAGGS